MEPTAPSSPDIVIFGHFNAEGGVQRAHANIIKEWVREGYKVELASYRDGVLFYPQELSQVISFVDLKVHNKLMAVFKLWLYLKKTRPSVVISNFHIDNKVLSYLQYLPNTGVQRFVSLRNNYFRSQRREHSKHIQKLKEIKRLYKNNHGIICVSEAITKDLQNHIGPDNVNIYTINNGTITPETLELAKKPVEHPWLNNSREFSLLITAGGLRKQKDHITLIDAIAKVRRNNDCRLLILGEGPLRNELTARARELGIEDAIDMPGFVNNPYAWMSRADCFALSSLWEGFPNVLVEALSLGTPLVSTDCPSGPKEILQDGRYGKLVPMSDSEALAKAIERTLNGEIERFDPMEAVEKFTARYASRSYLEVFGFLVEESSK